MLRCFFQRYRHCRTSGSSDGHGRPNNRKFPRWTRALLSDNFLAVLDGADGVSETPSRLWLLSEEDMAALKRSGTSAEQRVPFDARHIR